MRHMLYHNAHLRRGCTKIDLAPSLPGFSSGLLHHDEESFGVRNGIKQLCELVSPLGRKFEKKLVGDNAA